MADNYVLITDSACDILPEKLAEWKVEMIPLAYLFTDTGKEQLDHEEPIREFYKSMRDGRVAKTSSVNESRFVDAFTPILEAGKDLIYLAFSSGLSVTCENGKKVAATLQEKYPDRKIVVIDSLAASAGQGLFVYLAVQNRDSGMSLEDNARALEAYVLHVCHWFTVDDLVYLKRGGRISRTTALLGTALNVKPVLHVDNEGHLIKMTQVRGRKKSIRKMAERLGETILPESPIFISHGDCAEDAEMLKEILEKEYGKEVTLITWIGSVIGAHSGPGTLALFFLGTER
ncbi:MAG: DegV family protein [Clostridia bacterium]|jgi:DegV family protein with EDD domain|nr:DegV family protein [Clostridia bacterium]